MKGLGFSIKEKEREKEKGDGYKKERNSHPFLLYQKLCFHHFS
jgi:hypothetical protein